MSMAGVKTPGLSSWTLSMQMMFEMIPGHCSMLQRAPEIKQYVK